jgi:integrase
MDGTSAHLLVWLLDATGLRRGEALALKWDCVDLKDLKNASVSVQRNLVFVRGKPVLEDTPKTQAGIRIVPVPFDLAAALKEERAKATSLFVFHKQNGEMMSETAFRNR